MAEEPVRFDLATLRAVPRGIWVLGLVSMFMDISSEMIHALLPIYLVTVLGTPALIVGVIEGVAEATASVVKVFSGALSDWLGRRKVLAVAGYGLSALTKPVFPLAATVGWLVGARVVDRIGKGIRGAPRDALVADLAPAHLRGASFGLRQSLDTVGAFAGPLLAIGLMLAFGGNYRLVFWVAVVPAFLSAGLIIFGVSEPKRHDQAAAPVFPLRRSEIGRMPKAFWMVVSIAAVFTLARFSEAFLLLRAQTTGLPVALTPLVLVVMNAVYALSSFPAGLAADGKAGRVGILAAGMVVLILADLVLAAAAGVWAAMAGVALWGLHMGLTQGLLATLVADTAPVDLRGTAFGLFNLVSGASLLVASLLAGWLWDAHGPAAVFLTGAGFTALALAGILWVQRRGEQE